MLFRSVKRKVKTFCPECHATRHDKRDKSLSVDLDEGVWHCHYCGWSGHLEKEDWEKESERERYRYASVRKPRPEYKKPQPRPTLPMSDRAKAWFASRGISERTLLALKVTEGQEFMPQKNGQANTVQFNYYRNGELVNTKFRTGDKKFKLVSGAELLPYNIDAIRG